MMDEVFGGIPFIDILIFAIIAVFLGLKLRSILGSRTGFEQDFSRSRSATEPEADMQKVKDADLDGDGIEAVQAADADFSEPGFLDGATAAYALILEAFAEGDTDRLKPLLGYEMNISFADAIRERQKSDETLEIDLQEIERAVLSSAKLREGLATVVVEFTSRQKRMLKDSGGAIIEGDADETETFVDLWTFERDVRSSDPTWLLVEAETVQQ